MVTWEYDKSKYRNLGAMVAQLEDYRVEVTNDDYCEDPETTQDWFGTLVDPDIGWQTSIRAASREYGETVADRIRELRFAGYSVVPIRFADYGSGGATLSECDADDATGFHCASRERVLEEVGGSSEAAKRRMALRLLRDEVKTLGMMYSGEVFCFAVYDPDGELWDSCCGFIGEEYALEAAKEALEIAADTCPACRGKRVALGVPCHTCMATGSMSGADATGLEVSA